MAFVYCRNCDWEQDDCWSESYNPFKRLLDWQDRLLEKNLDEKLDGYFDKNALEEWGLVGKTWRDFLINELTISQNRIKNMKWKTEKDFKNDPDKKCPKCGSSKHLIWD
jgi:hypothetical protein